MTCKSMTVYNTVLGDGAVNDALVLEYSVPLLPDSIYPGAYEVFGRQILRAYVSERPEPGAPGRGPYVVLELDPVDILERIRGRDEHICIHEQSLAVRQREAVQAENGERLTAMKTFRIAVKNRTPQVEGFQQFQKDGIRYNLFAPAPLEKGRQYPMVLFIHDAGSNGSAPRLTLLQGLGATAFSSPETQAESPCFVLAPEIPAGCRMTADDFTVTPELEAIMKVVRETAARYPVDPDRIVTTGQSMGCMASCELLIRYPEFFAGALLVAGQWSPERMAESVRHTPLWILVSAGDRGAFPGMNAVTEAMERSGISVARTQWDGKAGPDVLEAAAQQAAQMPEQVKYTVFAEDSVKTPKNNGPGGNHGGTWALVYTIAAVRRWLLAQRRTS